MMVTTAKLRWWTGAMMALALFGYVGWNSAAKFWPQLSLEGGYFLKMGLDYDRLRGIFPFSDSAREALRVIPEGATVNFSPGTSLDTKANAPRVALRYYLYPLKVGDDWDFFIDFASEHKKGFPPGKVYFLRDGVKIYLRSGKTLRDHPLPEPPRAGWLRPLAAFLAVTGLMMILGIWLLRILSLPVMAVSRVWYFGTAYLLGLGTLVSVFWGWLMLGGRAAPGPLLGIWGVVLTVAGMTARRKPPVMFVPTEEGRRAPWGWREYAAGVLLLLAAGSVILLALSRVVIDWDGMSHWILKSKVIFTTGRLDLSYTHHNAYPMLWPLTVAAQFVAAGGLFDQMAQWTSASLFVVMLTQFWGGLAVIGLPVWKRSVLLTLYLIVIFYWYPFGSASSNAENLLMAFELGSLAALLAVFRGDKPFFALAVLFSIGMCLSKLEGGVTAVVTALMFVVYGCCFSAARGVWWRRALWFGLMVFLPAGWALWVNQHGFWGQFMHFRDPVTWGKIGLLLEMSLVYLISNELDVLVFLTILVLWLFRPRRPFCQGEGFLLITGLLLLAFALISGLGWPAEKILGDFADGFTRLALHAVPYLFFFLVSRSFAGSCLQRKAGERKLP